MAERSNQTVRVLRGINLDLAKELLKDQASFLKNVIGDYQNTNNAATDGQSHNLGLLTVPLSNSTTFDESFPCCVDYAWDLTAATFPADAVDITIGEDVLESTLGFANVSEIVDWLNTQGIGTFNVEGNGIFLTICTGITYGAIVVDGHSFAPTSSSTCATIRLTIGSLYDRKLNQYFWFVYDNANAHSVWMYDANTETFALIWADSLFNFSPKNLITSVDDVIADVSVGLVNTANLNTLLYWTDGNNQPRKLNVTKALSGGYDTVAWMRTTDEFMLQVKYPPTDINITNTLPNPDPAFTLNWIAGRRFQFRARWIYDDGEHSCTGAISTLAYTVVQGNNFIELNLFAGSELVTFVEIYYREGNFGDWKLYDTIDRSLIILNTTYPYDIATNYFTYKFFNNNQYIIVDQDEVNREFDYIPLKSQAQEFSPTENLMLHGDILEGYDNLTRTEQETPTIDIQYTPYAPLTLSLHITIVYTVIAPDIIVSVHRIDYETGDDIVENNTTLPNPGIYPATYFYVVNLTDVNFGDKVYLTWFGAGDIEDQTELQGIYSNIQIPLSCGTGDFNVKKLDGTQVATGVITMTTVVSDPCNTWDTATSMDTVPNYAGSTAQLFQGGTYNFRFIMYDAAMRSSFVQGSTNLNLNIDSIQQSGGFQTLAITVNWNGLVFPDWVYGVRLCRTQNLIIDRALELGYLYWAIVFNNTVDANTGFVGYDGIVYATVAAAIAAGTTVRWVQFSIQNIINYNTVNFNNTTTTYSWAQGDRVQFVRNGNGTYFDFATFGLVDSPIASSTVAPNVIYQCEYQAALSGLVNGALVYTYTPAKASENNTYFEIGDLLLTDGNTGNNQLLSPTTTVKTFDTFPIFWEEPYANNAITDSGGTPFQHHSIYATKIVPSNGEDIGRINFINVNARQIWKPATIRHSKSYIPNTYINGLSTYYEEDSSGNLFNRGDGGIEQMFIDGYKLFVLQEDGTFTTFLAKQLVQLADGSQQLVAAEQFFSDPIPTEGFSGGLQNSESFIEWNNDLYWVDTKRAAFCKFDWRECTDIARIGENRGGIKSYAEAKLKYVYNYNQNENSDNDFFIIPAGFDPKHKLVLWTFFNIFIPTGNSIATTDTGESVDRMQWGLGAENMYFVSGRNSTQYDIFKTTFCANIDQFNFEFFEDWGTPPNHYGVRLVGDRPDQPILSANGGFNCAVCCNTSTNCCVHYTVSFWANAVKWCLARGFKMLLNSNLNNYNIAAYIDNINYTDAQVGFVGLNTCQEFWRPGWCDSPLNANGAGVTAAANTLIAGLTTQLSGKIKIRDWKGINGADASLTDAYTDQVKNINSTSTRIYLSEDQLMTDAELADGRTPQQYLTSIDTAIDTTLPNRIADLIAIINQPVAITQAFSDSLTGFSGNFLQYYFYSRLLLKIIKIEADTPNSIELAIMPRVDMINAKGTLNDLGNTLLRFKNFYVAGNSIFYPTLPTGIDGALSVDGSSHGTAIIINSTATPLDTMSFTVNGNDRPFISVTSIASDSLDGNVVVTTGTTVEAFSINEVTF